MDEHTSLFQCSIFPADDEADDDDYHIPLPVNLPVHGALQPFPHVFPEVPEFQSELQDIWDQRGAVEVEEEGRILYVRTWFLNHEQFPVCSHHRVVRLGADPMLWLTQIIHEWRDLYNPQLAIHWNFVSPGPPPHAWENESPIHIIAQQQRLPGFASVLFSVMDNSQAFPQWQSHARVFAGPLTKSLAIATLELDDRCHPALSSIQCVVLHGHQTLDEVHPHTCDHGHGFLIILNDLMVRRAHEAHAGHAVAQPMDLQDDVSLLQRHPAQRRALQLASLISPEPQVRIPCADLCFLRGQVLDLSLGPILDFAQTVKWHPATQHALGALAPWHDEVPVHYAFFTDGTATPDHPQAASSVILIVYTLSGPRFGGFRTLVMGTSPSSARAEAGAILLAVLWALQLARIHPFHLASMDVSFTYDSFFAGKVASGAWKANAHRDILCPVRALVIWLCTIPNCAVEWHHVPSHSGHPYNEAADAACWAALNGWTSSIDLEPLVNILSFDGAQPHLVEWLWMLEAALHGAPGLPRLAHFEFVANIEQPFRQAPDVAMHPFMIREAKTASSGTLEHELFDFRCATANVLTLFSPDQRAGAYISGRQEELMEACSNAGFHCVGLQETRSRMEGHIATDEFHILSAPASSKGVGGIQLWIARNWPTSAGSVRIAHTDLRILHSSTQRLVVRIACPAIKLIVIVLHAPSGTEELALTRWWTATSNSVPSACRSWPWIVLADANARVGQFPSHLVGTAGAQEDNVAGTVFQEWLHQHHVALPQTFDAFHQGDLHSTWVHGTGAEARLDYVGVSSDLLVDGVRTLVCEVDLAVHRTDHRMVSLTLPWALWRPHRLPEACSVTMPEDIPQLAWQDDVHTHASTLQRWAGASLPHRSRRFVHKKHLTAPTWNLILAKRYHFRRLRQLASTHRVGILRAIFQAWHTRTAPAPAAPWLKLCDFQYAIHLRQHRLLCLRVTAAVRQDDTTFYADLAARHGSIEADEGLTGLWRSLHPLLPRQLSKRKSNIRSRGPDPGELADHYSRLECGIPTSYPDLVAACHQRQQDALCDAPLRIDLAELPTRLEMEYIAQSCKRGKAPGLDAVSIEHLRRLFDQHAQSFFELYLKSWILAAEPAQFKGGYIVSIAKKQGVLSASAMRGIMLLDCVGKIYHALARRHLMRWAGPRRHVSQFGGYQGQQCVFASLMLRTYCNLLETRKISCAVLFVDVKSAFHCLLRQQLFNGQPMPEALCELLHQEGLSPTLLNDIASLHSDQLTADAPPSLVRVLDDAHRGTWFTLPGAGGCFETLRGSRPGSPLADLAFNWLMTLLLTDLQKDIWDIPEVVSASAVVGHRPPLVTWVDDLAVPIPSCQACDLDDVVATVVSRVRAAFARYGLSLNFSSGKTEVIVQYRGTHAAGFRRERFIDNHRQLAFDSKRSVRLVSQYQHLGAAFAQGYSLVAELTQRLAKAGAAFNKVGKSILLNRHLSSQTRLQLLDSLVLPVLMYGAGGWALLPARPYQKIHHAVITWQRRILRTGFFWSDDRVSDADLQAQWMLPSLSMRLAKHRILLALQLQKHAPPIDQVRQFPA